MILLDVEVIFRDVTKIKKIIEYLYFSQVESYVIQ